MTLKIRLLAVALFFFSLLLGWRAAMMLGTSAHFGSTAIQVCATLTESADLARACKALRAQVRAMSDQYSAALGATALAAICSFLFGAIALALSFDRRGTPPNNSFKPNPLRGSA
ncbi:hypothetical protein C0063_12395 [Pseudoxanthomonas sp. KAs_5_3]|nr:hypothetical protein C0063_12395 [Pseudoxanthomonas sp. KAs_5_3]